MSTYKYFSPKYSLFGYDCISILGDEIKNMGHKKGIIVTDKFLCKNGIVEKVTKVFDASGLSYCIYDEVKPNPTIGNVNKGVALLKNEGCDFVVSIGGGSAHDCAKSMSLLATNGGEVKDYLVNGKQSKSAMPLIAINTTAGTASECTAAYVIVDEETNNKYGMKDPNVFPVIAVDDHSLMMGLPKSLTSSTGMDALTHAIESLSSNRSYPLTFEFGLSAIRLIFENLATATNKATEESREIMATAQYLAGLSFSNSGCGVVHSISHQLSAVYDLPHGLCNAILLPECMKFLRRDENVSKRYAKIAEVVFAKETSNMSFEGKVTYLIERVNGLSEAIGTKVKLGTLGVSRNDFDLLAEKTLVDGSFGNNILKPNKEEIIEIISKLM